MGSSSTDATAGGSVISLPTGGGAIGGLGETFSAGLFTGTGNFSVPITLPARRNGLAPQLTMGYSTGNGNGPFGLGWSASLPGVTRKTARGVPRYRDDGSVTRLFADSGLTSKPTDTIVITAITFLERGWTSYGRVATSVRLYWSWQTVWFAHGKQVRLRWSRLRVEFGSWIAGPALMGNGWGTQ